jgi:hypothetical protein
LIIELKIGELLFTPAICRCARIPVRRHLKNIFWPNLFVGASFQILEIQ